MQVKNEQWLPVKTKYFCLCSGKTRKFYLDIMFFSIFFLNLRTITTYIWVFLKPRSNLWFGFREENWQLVQAYYSSRGYYFFQSSFKTSNVFQCYTIPLRAPSTSFTIFPFFSFVQFRKFCYVLYSLYLVLFCFYLIHQASLMVSMK